MALVPRVYETCNTSSKDGETGDGNGLFRCKRKHRHYDRDNEATATNTSNISECQKNGHYDDAHEFIVIDGKDALVLARLSLAD